MYINGNSVSEYSGYASGLVKALVLVQVFEVQVFDMKEVLG